jgi:hypothetical protein
LTRNNQTVFYLEGLDRAIWPRRCERPFGHSTRVNPCSPSAPWRRSSTKGPARWWTC